MHNLNIHTSNIIEGLFMHIELKIDLVYNDLRKVEKIECCLTKRRLLRKPFIKEHVINISNFGFEINDDLNYGYDKTKYDIVLIDTVKGLSEVTNISKFVLRGLKELEENKY